MNRYARPALALVFVAMLATPALIRRFGSRADARRRVVGAGSADARTASASTESAKASGIDFVHEAPDARRQAGAHHAAGRLDGRGGRGRRRRCRRPSRSLRHQQQGRVAATASIATAATARSRTSPARFGVADVNQRETGVSMGAVLGDYDNDGFEDLFLYRWGRAELFHNDGGRGFTRVDRRARCRRGPTSTPRCGSTTTATAGSISSSAATTPRGLNLWKLADDEDHAGELRVREQRRPQVSLSQSRRRPVRGSERARSASRRRAGRSPPSPPICAAPAIPTSSSPTTTASRSSSSTKAAASAKSGARPASATRRRAA